MEKSSRLLAQSGFAKLWIGQTVSVLGSQLTGLALPVLAVTILGASELQMGYLNAADTAAFLLVGLPAGAWVDRWRKRQVMIAADVVRMVAAGTIPLLWFSGQLHFWHLIVVGAVMGISTVFFDVSYQSFVPILLPSEHIAGGNSALETTNQIAGLSGPAVVGFLLTLVKAPFLLIFDAASYAVSALTLMLVKDTELPKPKEDRQPLHKEIAEGLRFVVHHPLIRRISMTTALSNLFSTLMFTLMPLVILRDLGISPAKWGLVMSISSVGGLLGALSTPKIAKLIGEGTTISVAAVLSSLCMLTTPIAARSQPDAAIVWIGVGGFLLSFSVLLYNITQVSARQRLCPPHLLGRMNASIRFFVWGVMPISALLSGFLADRIGIQSTLWIGAAGSLLAAMPVLLSPLTRMQRLPEGPEAA